MCCNNIQGSVIGLENMCLQSSIFCILWFHSLQYWHLCPKALLSNVLGNWNVFFVTIFFVTTHFETTKLCHYQTVWFFKTMCIVHFSVLALAWEWYFLLGRILVGKKKEMVQEYVVIIIHSCSGSNNPTDQSWWWSEPSSVYAAKSSHYCN
mgnify:FL=1